MSVCCCLPLRPVGIFLGFLFLVGSLFTAALSGIALYDIFENSTAAAYAPTNLEEEYMETVPESNFVEENLPRVAFLFGHSAITVICSLMLIYGSLSVSRMGELLFEKDCKVPNWKIFSAPSVFLDPSPSFGSDSICESVPVLCTTNLQRIKSTYGTEKPRWISTSSIYLSPGVFCIVRWVKNLNDFYFYYQN